MNYDWKDAKDVERHYGMLREYKDPNAKETSKPLASINDRPLTKPGEVFESDVLPPDVHVPGPVEQHLHAGVAVRTLRGGAAAQELWAEQSQRVRDGLEPNKLDVPNGSNNYPYTDAEVEKTKPSVPTSSSKVQKIEKLHPSPVVVLGKMIDSVEAEYYSIRIYKQVDASYFGQVQYKSDNRIIEVHGPSFDKVRFDLTHLAQQGLEKHDTVLVSDPRSNRNAGLDIR
jgi:hypothetical protein